MEGHIPGANAAQANVLVPAAQLAAKMQTKGEVRIHLTFSGLFRQHEPTQMLNTL